MDDQGDEEDAMNTMIYWNSVKWMFPKIGLLPKSSILVRFSII